MTVFLFGSLCPISHMHIHILSSQIKVLFFFFLRLSHQSQVHRGTGLIGCHRETRLIIKVKTFSFSQPLVEVHHHPIVNFLVCLGIEGIWAKWISILLQLSLLLKIVTLLSLLQSVQMLNLFHKTMFNFADSNLIYLNQCVCVYPVTLGIAHFPDYGCSNRTWFISQLGIHVDGMLQNGLKMVSMVNEASEFQPYLVVT